MPGLTKPDIIKATAARCPGPGHGEILLAARPYTDAGIKTAWPRAGARRRRKIGGYRVMAAGQQLARLAFFSSADKPCP